MAASGQFSLLGAGHDVITVLRAVTGPRRRWPSVTRQAPMPGNGSRWSPCVFTLTLVRLCGR